MMSPQSIAAVNQLTLGEKTSIYRRFIPEVLRQRFNLPSDYQDVEGRDLLRLECESGSTEVILDLRHSYEAEDPLLYAHITDTINGQLHILLYIVNDPDSPRYNVDRMPDGSKTDFGTLRRNIEAELSAMKAGLAPGQVRSGLRILQHSIRAFEDFAESLGQTIYFVEPLYYHNAVIFERYGFAYQQGLKRMHAINEQFSKDGPLYNKLDDSTPFRMKGMEKTIRGRSWSIHDGILGEPFTYVTMYKHIHTAASITTFPDSTW
ncbi:MAG: hypothetical protein P8Z42_08220 [Anaerolineales bacterium]